jgi:hypothetical protein
MQKKSQTEGLRYSARARTQSNPGTNTEIYLVSSGTIFKLVVTLSEQRSGLYQPRAPPWVGTNAIEPEHD